MNNIKIEIAKKAGFCFGVQRAVDLVEEVLQDNKRVYCLGDLVHNPVVIKRLTKKGFRIIDDLKDLPEDAVFVIRSHGMIFSDIELAKKKTFKIVDATCPFVIKAQNCAKNFADENKTVLIVGDKNHIEVKGINSRTNNKAFVVNGVSDLKDILEEIKNKELAVVCQTTQKQPKLDEVVKKLKEWNLNFEVSNTICLDTTNKQGEVNNLSDDIDILIVIGGLHSSNTTKLAEIGRSKKIKTYHVETASDISENWFNGIEKVFITAGASTPPEELGAAKKIIEKFNF
jgi:4-hydroxy-3-methylbut-2-enyl diphosphate reductase